MSDMSAPEAAAELMRRMQAATRAQTDLGGWPQSRDMIRVLDGWFAEYGLHIDEPPARRTD